MPLDPGSLTYVLVYRDGTALVEAEALERGGFVACCALPGFESFVVLDLDAVTDERLAQVVIRDDMRPIFGRLWVETIDPNPSGGSLGRRLRAVCYGWQRTVAGRNVKALTWVTRQGVFVSDRDLDEIAGS